MLNNVYRPIKKAVSNNGKITFGLPRLSVFNKVAFKLIGVIFF
jgi:hypothetical protein